MAARASNPFSARMVFGLVAAGLVAFVAFALLTAYAGDFRSGRDGRSHALSVSAVGFKGLVDLIGYAGGATAVIRNPEGLETEDLVVVTIEQRSDPEALTELLGRRATRPTLLVLPKWMTQPDPVRRGWVSGGEFAQILPPVAIASLVDRVGDIEIVQPAGPPGALRAGGILEGISARAPANLQAMEGEELTPLLWSARGETVLARVGDGPLYLLSDPDLLNNMGLKDRRTATAALATLDALNSTGAEAVHFDLTLNGFARKPNALKLAFEPPFVVLTLALFVAALLAGLHGAVRFGPEAREERAIAFGKAALVENSAALFRLARREYRAGAAYADVVREEAARAAAAPIGLRGAELDAYLDRLSPPAAPRFSDLAARLRAAGSRDELVSAARALFLWKKELII